MPLHVNNVDDNFIALFSADPAPKFDTQIAPLLKRHCVKCHGPVTAEARKAAIAASAKPSCLVVDFVGNAGKHKLVTSADILGGKPPGVLVFLAAGVSVALCAVVLVALTARLLRREAIIFGR